MADLLSGYNIKEKLGIGARSQIYQVTKPDSEEAFALKRVVREEDEDTRFLDQAITEFEVSSKIQPPDAPALVGTQAIPQVDEAGRSPCDHGICQRRHAGKATPGANRRRHRPFHQTRRRSRCHSQGRYVHADIKPNNIILTDEGPKIIDFGQSCPIGFIKPRIQGTPDYIAPEQVKRRHLTAQTDVYNLGATLYWALTGQTFPTLISRKGKSDEFTIATGAGTPSPQQLNPAIPSVLSRLVMESCAFRRSDRPNDMKDVIKRLEMASM